MRAARHPGSTAVMGLIAALTVAAVLPLLVTWSSLPDPVAIQWRFSGSPGGSASRTAVVVGIVGAALAVGAYAARLALRRPPRPGDGGVLATLSFVSTVLAGGSLLIALANRGATTWADAHTVSMAVVLPMIAIPCGVLWWVRRLVGPTLAEPRLSAPTRVVAPIPHQTRWASTTTSRWQQAVSAGLGVLGIAGLAVGSLGSGAFLLVLAVVVAPLTSVRVDADSTRVLVLYGPLRWPRTRVDLARVRAASVVQVRPLAFGGWGYRTGRHGRAVIVRGGDALRLDIAGAKTLLVTVDDAATGAGVISGLIAARQAG